MKIFENNQQAAHVFHPGLIVADEIETLGLSVKQASLALDLSQTDLQKLFAENSFADVHNQYMQAQLTALNIERQWSQA